MKKLLSCLLLIAMVMSCMTVTAETAPATIIDFADGNYAFLGVDTTAGNADACELSVVEFPGFTCKAGGWSQSGFEIPDEFRAAMVPGSVIEISFESGNGTMWLVFPDSAAGWKRIQQQTADTDGQVAQITFEEIASVLGEDVSAWGARLQCESSGSWNVYSVTVGQAH